MRLKKIILNNVGLKSLALLLAFVTWFYIGETTKLDSEKTVLQKLLSSTNYVSKKLYIKPIFVGSVPEGYIFLENEVKVMPDHMVVAGPSRELIKTKFIYTKPIDLSEYTKTKTVDVELQDISRSIKLKKMATQVFVPIKEIENVGQAE